MDFERVLDQNVTRILAEIDRLDEIARAFSRYGMAPADRERGDQMDVATVLRDVVELERMGEGGRDGAGEDAIQWELSGADEPAIAIARRDELREVVLNVLENARLANARRIQYDCERTGRGSRSWCVTTRRHPVRRAAAHLRAAFSTRTSGADSARLQPQHRRWVEGDRRHSQRGEGTEVRIALATAASP